MAGRIPQSFIDDLLNRVDIVEVIDSRVPLKKAGRDHTACCPFHNEKTPSFTVSQSKQFFHCFGCGVHGSAIGFLMDYEHMEFPEAVEELARLVGVQVPHEGGDSNRHERQGPDFYQLLANASQFFQRQLRDHPQASRAVDYLKARGLSGKIAAQFGIGYAPPGWESLASSFSDKAAERQAALDLGLLVKRDNGTVYDRFRDRIMFPIRDRRGRVIGFGGRVLGDEKPKYMNSPESAVFHKGQELYGLFEARKAERALHRLLVVEGYMDVVALAQHGIHNAVATLGTATTADHLERLFRVVPEIVFCFDGDNAGRKAAWRALENSLPVMRQGREARFLFLPEAEDPDSLVRKEGREPFLQRVEDSVPLSDFFYAALKQQVDTRSMDGRARLAELARPLLQAMPDDLFRDMMVDRLADITQLDRSVVRSRILGKPAGRNQPERPLPNSVNQARSPIRTAISLLLQQPPLARQVSLPPVWAELELNGIGLLIELVELLQDKPDYQTGAILEHWRGRPEQKHLAKLSAMESEIPEQGLEEEFLGLLERLQEQTVEQRTRQLLDKSRAGLDRDEKLELQQLLGKRQSDQAESRYE